MYRVHFFLIALCSFLYFRLYTTLNENTIELLRKLPHGDRDESKCHHSGCGLVFRTIFDGRTQYHLCDGRGAEQYTCWYAGPVTNSGNSWLFPINSGDVLLYCTHAIPESIEASTCLNSFFGMVFFVKRRKQVRRSLLACFFDPQTLIGESVQ